MGVLFFYQYGGHLFREVERVKVSRWHVCGRLGGSEWYVSSRERTEVTFRTPSGLHDIQYLYLVLQYRVICSFLHMLNIDR